MDKTKIDKTTQKYIDMYLNQVDLDKLTKEHDDLLHSHSSIVNYKGSHEELDKSSEIIDRIIGYMVGNIGNFLERHGWYTFDGCETVDLKRMDDSIYHMYREARSFANAINQKIGFEFIDQDFFITRIFGERLQDDNTIDYGVPYDYDGVCGRLNLPKTRYPQVYNRILDTCITGEGANGRRFKKIADKFIKFVENQVYMEKVEKFIPYKVTPYEDLIKGDRSMLIGEILACTAALGNYADVFGAVNMSSEEISNTLLPLVQRITFLRYCADHGGITEELVNEFEADHLAFIKNHDLM